MPTQTLHNQLVAKQVLNNQQRSTRMVARISLLIVILLACMGLGFTVFALSIQSSTRAYIMGETYWSKAQQEAVYFLERYAQSAEPEYLQQARDALRVPLADRTARLALEKLPPDLETARRAFIEGKNHPADVPGMIWLYQHFADAPYFAEAIDFWRRGDEYILQIEDVATQLEQAFQYDTVDSLAINALRDELERLNNEVRPIEAGYTESLREGTHWLEHLLIILSVLMLVLVIGIAAAIFWWATRRIYASEHKFRATFEHAAVGMAQMDINDRFIDANDTLALILQMPMEEILQSKLEDVTHRKDIDKGGNEHELLLVGNIESYSIEKRLLRNGESPIWCKLTISGVGEPQQPPKYLILVAEDISEARNLSSELKYQAKHDALTGLINRPEFEHRLEMITANARTDVSRHTLCFIDLDQFKVINDTCGHLAGDQILRQATGILREHMRQGDVLARLGGDEFGVIFSYCSIDDALPVAEKLRSALATAGFYWEQAQFNVTCSMGLVEINDTTTAVTELLRAADTACYVAKDRGRNCLHVYSQSDLTLTAKRNEMEWVGRIRTAIGENRLQLFAQKIVSLGNADELRYELLVRLVDQDGKFIAPNLFLPAAERYNIATLIDEWVINASFKNLADNPDHLQQLAACHINLSAQSIGRSDFLEMIKSRLDHYAIPAGKICLEITETAAMTSLIDARQFIKELTQRGCKFALDDFGSGLSSFGYLRSLPVDIIKIDGTFVRDIVKDEIHQSMVRSIHEIGRLMGKRTVAEYVESVAILEILQEMGIDYAQGFALHKPCLFEKLLTEPDQVGNGYGMR